MKILKGLVIATAALLLGAPAAFAAPSALAKVCAADVKQYCGDVKPGKGAVKDCVKAHYNDLSPDCQVAIVRAAAVGKACKADVKQYCADVKPGKGAVADCIKSHASEVSDGCKDAMAKAEAGNK